MPTFFPGLAFQRIRGEQMVIPAQRRGVPDHQIESLKYQLSKIERFSFVIGAKFETSAKHKMENIIAVNVGIKVVN